MKLSDFLELLSTVLFDTTLYFAPLSVLYIIGLWKMLEKAGIKGRYALVPVYRDYKLSVCAAREQDGRVLAFIGMIDTVFDIVMAVLTANLIFVASEDSVLASFILMTRLAVVFVGWVYRIRIINGILEVYQLRRRWMILFLTSFTRWIPALILGFSPKYTPKFSEEDIHADALKSFSGQQSVVMDKGLTVNLRTRTVMDFFEKKTLLKDIHMNIEPGHMVLLLGGSGSGKTTFLNAVNGYEKADADIHLNGTDVYRNYKRMQYEVGYVPQTELIRPKDTVYHTLDDSALLRLPRAVSSKERRQRVESVLETFGLTRAQGNLVEKMSGGQKKRLSIAMEYVSNPSLFILDEPDSGLDGVMARSLMKHLRSIADQGKIVIVITHTPDRVADLFDDVIVLARDSSKTGRLAYFGSIKDSYDFFGVKSMEEIVLSVNGAEEGGKGLAGDFILKYREVSNG